MRHPNGLCKAVGGWLVLSATLGLPGGPGSVGRADALDQWTSRLPVLSGDSFTAVVAGNPALVAVGAGG